MTCSECKKAFPDDLVQPMCVNGDYIDVCGICALQVTREVHGIPDYEFSPGSMAAEIYNQTKAYDDKWNLGDE